MPMGRRVASSTHFGVARTSSLLAATLTAMASSRALPASMCGSIRARLSGCQFAVSHSAHLTALPRDARRTQTNKSSKTPMSDTSTQEGASHRQGGRGRNRRSGGKNFRSGGNRGGSSRGSGQGRDYEFKPDRKPKQTGFQKLLSMLTFGMLGKPKPRSRPASSGGSPTARDNKSAPRSDRAPRAPRPPIPAGEVTTDRLYVGNLSYDATESDLFELFSGVGQVKNSEVVVNSRTERSKGFAFVTMASIEQAKRAVEELNGKEFMGRQLQVNGAKPPSSDRGDRPDRRDSRDESESTDEDQSNS